jgi:hypothetical protein
MSQSNSAISEKRHKEFIEQTVKSGQVWGLKSKDGWATSTSIEFDDTGVLPFWSSEGYASACAKDDWSDYQPDEFSLSEFLEHWCIGMDNDNALTGTNWDSDLFGHEIEPLNLALEILEEVKAQKKNVNFLNYPSLNEFEKAIIQLLKEKDE